MEGWAVGIATVLWLKVPQLKCTMGQSDLLVAVFLIS